MPASQAMFRSMCRNALKGDNAALRRIIDLLLTLEPEAHQQAEQKSKASDEARRKLRKMAGLDPDAIPETPKAPDPQMEEYKKQADALAKEERKRLIRLEKAREKLRY